MDIFLYYFFFRWFSSFHVEETKNQVFDIEGKMKDNWDVFVAYIFDVKKIAIFKILYVVCNPTTS